ncbi:MAG: ASPIC/UnbV domain-containing protein, partial [Blastocatellia bacterium]
LGRGNFADVTAEAGAGVNTPRAHRGAAIGDFDNDGDLDALLADLDGGPTLLDNRSQPRGAYLRVKAPAGSRITVEAAGMKQSDETRASGSYQSASEQAAHFGLGGASIVERVSVRFPNGKARTLTSVKVNQSLTFD